MIFLASRANIVQTKKLMVLRFPPSPVPKSMKRTRRYAADTIGLALYFRVVGFQVRLKVEADGLQGRNS
jgi:hypothetical protein